MTTNEQPGTPAIPAGYTPIRKLGRGRLGRLALCRDETGAEVALRILDVAIADERDRLRLASELNAAIAASTHPCATALGSVTLDPA